MYPFLMAPLYDAVVNIGAVVVGNVQSCCFSALGSRLCAVSGVPVVIMGPAINGGVSK